jgi:hypothetical protein
VDDQNGGSYLVGEVRKFPVTPTASVSKDVLTITKVPLNVARDSIATRINELGFIESVPPNTPRFTYDPLTLEPLGLLIEPEAENLITQSDITSSQWTRSRLAVTPTLSIFANPVYLLKGNGGFLQHAISILYPTVTTPTLRTLFIYMNNFDNRFAQMAIGSDPYVFVNFDLEQGVLGTQGVST